LIFVPPSTTRQSINVCFQVQFQTSKVSFEVRSSAATHQRHDDGNDKYICMYESI